MNSVESMKTPQVTRIKRSACSALQTSLIQSPRRNSEPFTNPSEKHTSTFARDLNSAPSKPHQVHFLFLNKWSILFFIVSYLVIFNECIPLLIIIILNRHSQMKLSKYPLHPHRHTHADLYRMNTSQFKNRLELK